MKPIFTRIVTSPLRSILVAVLLTLGFASGLGRIYVDPSTTGLLSKGDPDVAYLKQIREVFSDAVIHTIIIKSDTVFRPDILEQVIALTFDAEGIQGVDRVVSMATVSNLKGAGGILNTDMLLSDLPRTPEEMAVLKSDTLSNPMFVGEVINPAGTVTGIHLFLSNPDGERGFESRIVTDIEALVERVKKALPRDAEIYHIGYPKVKADTIEAIKTDSLRLVPLAGLALALVLFWFFKTFAAAAIPLITGVLSIISTLGFMGWLGFGLNPVSVLIPTLLFVMGATEDIHLVSEYIHELENKAAKPRAIMNMAVRSGTAILLTTLTTFLGFGTIIPNAIPILHEFAIAAAFGIAVNFILTILIVPAFLNVYKTPKTDRRGESRTIQTIRHAIFTCITRCRTLVGFVALLVSAFSIWGLSRVQVETDYLKFFKPGTPVPVLFDRLQNDLVGGTNFLVVVESDTPDAFQTHGPLSNLARLHDYLNAGTGKTIGYVDMIRKTHQEMNDGDPAFFDIPENDDLIAQYNLMMDADSLNRFVNYDFTKTSMLVRTRASGTRELMGVCREINQWIEQNMTRDMTYHITGEAVVVAKASNTIIREVLLNLGYMLLAIFLLISALFLSFKAGAMAMIPNALPVVINFGVMGFLGIPLSVATFPVAIISLGIAVDDTIHFMVRYAKALKRAESNEAAIMDTIRIEFRPILSTSVALIAGFLVLLFGQFGSTIQFGKLAALCMATALVSDLLITPLLLIKRPIISPVDLLRIYIGRKLDFKTCQLLAGLKRAEIRRVLTMGEIRLLNQGEQFITQGAESRNMVLILEGSVDVVEEKTGQHITSLDAGDIVGEMGFITGEVRSASVITRSQTELFEIDERLMILVAKRFPGIGNKLFLNISRILARRLKETNARLEAAAS